MEPHRSRPPPDLLAWAARQVSPTARVVAWRRLTGGGARAAVHRLTVLDGAARRHLVVRRGLPGRPGWEGRAWEAARGQAAVLDALASTTVPAPRAVAVTDGAGAGGRPALLMTRAPGHLWLDPPEPSTFADRLAATLVVVSAPPLLSAAPHRDHRGPLRRGRGRPRRRGSWCRPAGTPPG